MKDKAGHAKASITMLAGGTTQFSTEFIKSIAAERLSLQTHNHKTDRQRQKEILGFVVVFVIRERRNEDKKKKRVMGRGEMGWQ